MGMWVLGSDPNGSGMHSVACVVLHGVGHPIDSDSP
jgi:hypothetical protein